jgi:hypothetical protein
MLFKKFVDMDVTAVEVRLQGKFALRRIQEYLTFPDQQPSIATKPKLKLIINNQVTYEHTPG